MKQHLILITALSLSLVLVLCCHALAATCTNHSYILESTGSYSLKEISVSTDGHLCRYYAYWRCEHCGVADYRPANDPYFPDRLYAHAYDVRSTDLGHVGSNLHAYVFVCSRSFNGNGCNYTQIKEISCSDDCPHYINKKAPVVVTE